MEDDQNRALALIGEMNRLAGLTGNCGRVISRFIERAFDGNEVEIRFAVPKAWDLLDVACFVQNMNEEIRFRRDGDGLGMVHCPYIGQLTVFPWLSTKSVSYVVRVEEMPSSVAERREMLSGIASTLDWAMDSQGSFLREPTGDGLRAWFLGSSFSANPELLEVFGEVVRGVYTRLETLPPPVLALANVLNSQVAAAAQPGTDLKVIALGAAESEEEWYRGRQSQGEMSALAAA